MRALGERLQKEQGSGSRVLTLAQVRARPEILELLSVGKDHFHEVGPGQAQQAEACLVASLPALAPEPPPIVSR